MITNHLPFTKNVYLLFPLVLLVLSACSDEPKQNIDKIPQIQTVKLSRVMDAPKRTERVFPAEVSAVKTIDVSFEVSGRLISTNLQASALVKKGDVLAKIDPSPFEQLVDEAFARFEQAKRDLDRVSTTYEKGLASLSEFDGAKTNFELAEIALQRAKKDLSYTVLIAPFDAQVSERIVDKGSFVKVGDIIGRLQDISRYYFNINVPERLVSRYKKGTDINAEAFIISTPDKRYTLEYVEHDTQPDPITQTYKVVFAAQAHHGNLTPGARAVVNVSLGYQSYGEGLLVPFTALVGSNDNGFIVWLFNQNTQKVQAVPVDVLHIEDGFALVSSALNPNDLVVSAGANKMREGATVKPYQTEH